jgi:hypothetical protein
LLALARERGWPSVLTARVMWIEKSELKMFS